MKMILYQLVLEILILGLKIHALFSEKSRQLLQDRKNLLDRSLRLKKEIGKRPLWIFHGSSVGETMQLIPIAELFQDKAKKSNKRKSVVSAPFILFTYFSPSARNFSQQVVSQFEGNSQALPLPFDRHRDIKPWLDILKPGLFITASYDVWPLLISILQDRKIYTGIIAAQLSPTSKRFSGFMAKIYIQLYQDFNFLDTIDTLNFKRFETVLGRGKRPAISSSGDPRCDYIESRSKGKEYLTENHKRNLIHFVSWYGELALQAAPAKANKISSADEVTSDDFLSKPAFNEWLQSLQRKRNKKPLLVLASTYSECESILIPELPSLLSDFPNLSVALVPHEVNREHIQEIEGRLKQLNISYNKLGDEQESKSVILIDVVGILLQIYSFAHMVFVGGSFHKKIHNVYEPARYALPLSFGPKFSNSSEASRLLSLTGAVLIQNGKDFQNWVKLMLEDKEAWKSSAQINQGDFQSNLGAAKRLNKLIQDQLSG